MTLDPATAARMGDYILGRCAASPAFKRELAEAVGTLLYEVIHTNCSPGCVCTTPRTLHNKGAA